MSLIPISRLFTTTDPPLSSFRTASINARPIVGRPFPFPRIRTTTIINTIAPSITGQCLRQTSTGT